MSGIEQQNLKMTPVCLNHYTINDAILYKQLEVFFFVLEQLRL
jgi:hypothetical protein